MTIHNNNNLFPQNVSQICSIRTRFKLCYNIRKYKVIHWLPFVSSSIRVRERIRRFRSESRVQGNDSGAKGRRFDSSRGRKYFLYLDRNLIIREKRPRMKYACVLANSFIAKAKKLK